jgi:hypothetical protein
MTHAEIVDTPGAWPGVAWLPEDRWLPMLAPSLARAILVIPAPQGPGGSDRQGATLSLLSEVDLRLRMAVQCRLVPELGWRALPQDVVGAVAFVLSDEPLDGPWVWTGLSTRSGPWPYLDAQERERRRAEVLSHARECVIPQAFELLRERCQA